MFRHSLVFILSLFIILSVTAWAQDEDLESTLDYKINKMTTELKLTDTQAEAIRPVIKNYMIKRKAILDQTVGEGIIDHVAIKSSLKVLKENEYQGLSKILSDEQMQKLINKENLMATLNPDGGESAVDGDASITPTGANLKF